MRWIDMDWSSFNVDYFSNMIDEVVKSVEAEKTKKPNLTHDWDQRISRKVRNRIMTNMLNAALLGEHAVVANAVQALVNAGYSSNNSVDTDPLQLVVKASSRGSQYFIKDNPGVILLVHEKHGIRYFDFSTPDKAAKAILKLVSERLSDGYYHEYDDEVSYEDRAQPDLFIKPEPSTLEKIKDYLEISKNPKHSIWAAHYLYGILMSRTENQYENIEIGYLEYVE